MEWVELIEVTEEKIRLRYYPEQNAAVGEYGEVTYFRETDDWQFDKLAAGYPSNYALHACTAAQRLQKQGGKFPQNGLVAWY